MAASAKKKLDEYHLKVLRQLVTLSSNKECFDCHQRGPTYVNVTIGSFVCTTCSGMLRGLTPPHRVKSISMATFTPEEIDFVKARGNEYCRRTWLGLLDSTQPTKDEQQIKDFMIAKYEKKRYYIDSAVAATLHKTVSDSLPSSPSKPCTQPASDQHTPVALPVSVSVPPHPTSLAFKPPTTTTQTSNNSNVFTPEPFADFSKMVVPAAGDPFNSSQSAAVPALPGFANFDNNPVFCSSTSTGMPGVGEAGVVPGEDRYAALKDLDCLMKSQQQPAEPATATASEWTAGMSNGITSVWSSPSLFPSAVSQDKDASTTSNPFKGDGIWNNGTSVGANPFRSTRPISEVAWTGIPNGQVSNGFTTSQSLNFGAPKVPWNHEAINNPFALAAPQQPVAHHVAHHSSNPFL